MIYVKSDGLGKAGTITLVSAVALVSIGLIEIFIGFVSNSIGLVADGVDSIGNSSVSFIVWLGINISRRSRDRKFHFGYYRVETLASLSVGLVMVATSAWVFYNAYGRLVNPEELAYPLLSIATIILAGIAATVISIVKCRLAAKYNMLSIKADARNSIKDALGSFIILAGMLLYSAGLPWGDSIGAMIVSVFIFSYGIAVIKEASLILVDAFHNPELMEDISEIIGKYPTVKLKDMKLRMSGHYLNGEILIKVGKNITLDELFKLKQKIKKDIMEEIEGIKNIIISAEPARL